MHRPLGITLLALLAVLGALANFLIGWAALTADDVVFGVLDLALGAVMLAFAYGAWTARSWAWYLGLGIFGLSVLNALLSTIAGGSLLGPIIIGVLAIGVLLQANTRQYLGHGAR